MKIQLVLTHILIPYPNSTSYIPIQTINKANLIIVSDSEPKIATHFSP